MNPSLLEYILNNNLLPDIHIKYFIVGRTQLQIAFGFFLVIVKTTYKYVRF